MQLIGWEDLHLWYLSWWSVSPTKTRITRLKVIYCNDIMDVFPTRNVVNFLISFTFLTATKFSKTWYSAESAISTKRVSSVSNQAYTNRSCSRRHTPSLLGHCKQKAMQDDGVVYVAGHPLLPGCIRLRNYLYCVGEAQLNSTHSLHH